jgi:hypothetical protein
MKPRGLFYIGLLLYAIKTDRSVVSHTEYKSKHRIKYEIEIQEKRRKVTNHKNKNNHKRQYHNVIRKLFNLEKNDVILGALRMSLLNELKNLGA